ncbi:striatin-interacting protein 1 homolog isoform X2 [Octopus bimaculoides]|uniref:Far11/STRP C-terminal domain-containing protein n=1 Tax=Octopus bimaculoides TaxID=37653 RepID=A0A0L8GW77_OCTBM|nr:striatin-interacting protein 1 homolog isoform X2 [Octopus bimaculoides]|eukprot:XP_014777551.1 PREDICTED: striatin-interacting protein 1 homolog isoform X2 [Octopus bimaculoides]
MDEGGWRGLPKLQELFRRQRRGSETINESPDLEFSYGDSDFYENEISELYCYTEEPEFQQNLRAFEDTFASKGYEQWTSSTESQQKRFLVFLQNELEMADAVRRMAAIQSILYLVQGVFSECDTEDHQEYWAKRNVFLIYEMGLFTSCVHLLHLEMDNKAVATAAQRKPCLSIADCKELRIILNVLYTVVETMRCVEDTEEEKKLKNQFKAELTMPYIGDEILAVTLFGMVSRFCSGTAPHFPIKKILLLLWKIILLSLGGLRELQDNKNMIRNQHGLPGLPEDPYEVCKNMRASSPPASTADLIEQQMPKRGVRGKRISLDGYENNGNNNNNTGTIGGNGEQQHRADDDLLSSDGSPATTDEDDDEDDDTMPPKPPRPLSTPPPLVTTTTAKCLPWKPKVRLKDLELFLDQTRAKFVGFQVKGDHSSLAGLPQPIHEGVKVLREHLYISLSELQIKREDEIAKNPFSMPEKEIPNTPTELLYQALLPSLPQYSIALLKILLAACPTSKTKSESINILTDVLPHLTNDQEPDAQNIRTTVLQSVKLEIDINRHKEIITKAISGLLLLLLKHFKLNHIYQFEFLSQHLVLANCIPLVLKFFNQNIMSYVATKNSIVALDFPSCVIGEQIEITGENLENGDDQVFCWRNLFSCINLLRILNKLIKWKHARTMMLVVFKSHPFLKHALTVKQSMMQLYVLKLLKMQTKYLGRQWRKSNMKTMSAIYQKVRHRLNDDWAFGNDLDTKPWDFQAEECALRACVDRFNNRRYGTNGTDVNFTPVDNCILSVLGQNLQLSDDFKHNYELWLEQEVFSNQVDWDQILHQ